MQALNVIGQIRATGSAAMKLRELMIADMSSKQAYQAAIIQEQAATKPRLSGSFHGGPVNNTGVTYWPGR